MADFLAFDLGAESGRAMLGRLRDGKLAVNELRRFPNRPVRRQNSLHWNIRALWDEIRESFSGAPDGLRSAGVDTWGVDFALLDRAGNLIQDPYHYRDARTHGAMDDVFRIIPRERLYSITGTQFLPFNTLYQIYRCDRELLDAADCVLTIPDLLNYWLTGNRSTEYTIASTTQLIDARTRTWSEEIIDALGFPRRLFFPIVEPGTEIGDFRGVKVIAPGCHDTASAVAAVRTAPDGVFLSSGTWSLMGAEIEQPVLSDLARDLNFTNEGGVCGTIRLLKNIAGLWLLESCRRCWADGRSYDDLLRAAAAETGWQSLVNPDDDLFLNPTNMPQAIAHYCDSTGQPPPQSPAAFTRAILESLVLKYRMVLEWLEQITGRRFRHIRIIGGGSRNALLNQLTANATGRTVLAGPMEATALGNIAMQMIAAVVVDSLESARTVIERSFPVERFEPQETEAWEQPLARFRDYCSRAVTPPVELSGGRSART